MLATAEGEPLPDVGVAIDSGASEEGETTGYFEFYASSCACGCDCGASSSVTVRYARRGTADRAPGNDYTGALIQDSVDVPLNSNAFVPFKAVDDTRLEGTESVDVSITDDPSYTVVARDATGTILDNEVGVTIHQDTNVTEGGIGSATLTVRRTSADGEVAVSITPSGTAGPGVDYNLEGLGEGRVLSMAQGEAEAQFRVVPINDLLIERPETARLSISIVSGTNHVLGKERAATVTIVDDDGGEQPPHDGGNPPPGGGPGGGGPGGPGTGVPEDPDPAEPNAWVDLGLGGWGWWWYEEWYGKEGEKHYGSTTDGAGLTSGALLRLNRDYDESADYQGTTPPPTDLEIAGITPWDGEVAPLWLWGWTDSGEENAAVNSHWTVTWDESKVNIWVPVYDTDGNFVQYTRKYNEWSGTLEEMYQYHEDWWWWWGWGLGAIVDPVGVSAGIDDLSIVATLTPAGGSAVQDTVMATVFDADLDAHRTGGKFGEKVDDFTQWKGDPTKYLVLTNNDIEEAPSQLEPPPEGEEALAIPRDFNNDRAYVPAGTPAAGEDDDLFKITLKRARPLLGSGTARMYLSDHMAVKVFDRYGSLLYAYRDPTDPKYNSAVNDPSVLVGDLSSGGGALGGLASGDLDVWLEGVTNNTNFTVSLVYTDERGFEVGRDDVHVLLAEWTFRGIDGREMLAAEPVWKDALLAAANDSSWTDTVASAGGSSPTFFKVQIDGLPSELVTQLRVTSDTYTEDYYDDELVKRSCRRADLPVFSSALRVCRCRHTTQKPPNDHAAREDQKGLSCSTARSATGTPGPASRISRASQSGHLSPTALLRS